MSTRHKTAECWMGKKVKVVRQLRNSYVQIEPGAIMEIIGKRGGFSLRGETCPQCRVRPIINRVEPKNLVLIQVGEKNEPKY